VLFRSDAIDTFLTVLQSSNGTYHHFYGFNPIKYNTSTDGLNLSGLEQSLIFSLDDTYGLTPFTNEPFVGNGVKFIKGFIKDDRIYIGFLADKTPSYYSANLRSLTRGFWIMRSK
jgi:hypothetical protein